MMAKYAILGVSPAQSSCPVGVVKYPAYVVARRTFRHAFHQSCRVPVMMPINVSIIAHVFILCSIFCDSFAESERHDKR